MLYINLKENFISEMESVSKIFQTLVRDDVSYNIEKNTTGSQSKN